MFLEAKGRRDELQKLQDAWSASGAIARVGRTCLQCATWQRLKMRRTTQR